jgi:hypothetical protein
LKTLNYLKRKEEEEEARRIKQRIHECNEASQDQWSGGASTHILPWMSSLYG